MIHNGDSDRQIEFPPLQTHDKRFEYAMLAISIALAILVLVILLVVGALAWLLLGGRRREGEKYAGLRILR